MKLNTKNIFGKCKCKFRNMCNIYNEESLTCNCDYDARDYCGRYREIKNNL